MVSVVICTRNRASLLEKAVQSILPQLEETHELLIVDNGSTDGTPQLCSRLSAEDSRIRTVCEAKPGLSVARNLALHEARGDWVIFLDDDTVVQPGWLAAYDRFFLNRESNKVASAGGSVIPMYESSIPKWLPPPPKPPNASVPARPCARGESVIGCNFAVRRELALAVGSFNPLLGHCGHITGAYDEVDLIERLVRAGYEIWWVTGACVEHLVSPERLRLTWQLSSAFRVGNCSAIRRLSQKTSKTHCLHFSFVRIFLAPFQCAAYLLAAASSLLLRKRRKATRSLLRASSTAGFACELVRRLRGQKYA